MKLIIVSGMSGSGKSVVLGTLEDLGYYCIDNLPVGLLPDFAKQMLRAGKNQMNHLSAVAIDARNMVEDLRDFAAVMDQIKELQIPVEIIFLDADKKTLMRRFGETRRRHPLTDSHTSLEEAIERENTLLSTISEYTNLRLDTTYTNVHQLRELVIQRLAAGKNADFSLMLTSFGFKHSVPVDANLVFDVRCLPNPHWDVGLRKLTGHDAEVKSFLEKQDDVQTMLDDIKKFLDDWLPKYKKENRSYLTVAIGCTGGQHRSVYLVEKLAKLLEHDFSPLLVRHRELV